MTRCLTILLASVAGLFLLSACSEQPQQAKPVTQLPVPADCKVLDGCQVGEAGISLAIQFETQPRALHPFPVRVTADTDRPLEQVTVSFVMRGMEMGLNRYALQQGANGEWTGSINLPICVSGRTDWVAEFELQSSDRNFHADVPFVLSK